LAEELEMDGKETGAVVSAGEFLLEALYINNRLGKTVVRGKTFFRK
jgi:hypothetical protein